MTTTLRERRTWLFSILVLLVGWFAMPYASQDSANEGFILFSTDRDNPDMDKTCPSCEEIYVMPADGFGPTRITNNKGNDILFSSNRNGNPEIYVMNADGTEPVRLTTRAGADANPDWSPNADRIAFEGTIDGNGEIFVMNADGSSPQQLTYFAGLDTKPSWSPTGDPIAFHRQIGQHLEVYTMNADGTDQRQITSSPPNAFSRFPSWGKWSALAAGVIH